MTLPQLVFFLVSKSYQYDYGIKEGLYWLIIGLLLWLGTFVIARIEKGIFEGGSFSGFIFGIILNYRSIYNFIMLYQYLQATYL